MIYNTINMINQGWDWVIAELIWELFGNIQKTYGDFRSDSGFWGKMGITHLFAGISPVILANTKYMVALPATEYTSSSQSTSIPVRSNL